MGAGMDVAKTDLGIMKAAAATLGLTVARTREGTADILAKHFAEMPPKNAAGEVQIGDCDVCGYTSALDLPACPFCGTGENGTPPAAEAAVEDEDENDVDIPGTGEDPHAITEPSDILDGDAGDVAGDEVPATKKPRRNAKAKANGASNGHALAVAAKNGIVPATTAHEGQIVDEKEEALDKAVAEIKNLERGAQMTGWALADRLSVIAESQLWKARKTAVGKVAHKTYEEFAKTELGMTREYANLLLKIRSRFKEEDVAQIGVTKLRLVIGAPKEEQAKVLADLKGGKSRRQVERDQKGKATPSRPKSDKEKKTAMKGGTITIAAIEGKKTLSLYREPAVKGETKHTPAKKIGDKPWTVMDLGNDTKLYLMIVPNAAGEWVVKTTIKRVDK